jgi:shikimate dehydrogenase
MHIYGLIGYPLGHSFSKQYFTEKFQREGITDCRYEIFPIDNINLLTSVLRDNPDLQGLNVTIPYKEQVLQFVTHVSDEVAAIGAANCIKIASGELTAFNTDIIGFQQSFAQLLQPHHTKALILGTGGSSKAVQYVLGKMGIEFLVVSRTEKDQDNCITYAKIDEAIMQSHNVVINCSPAGMSPNDDTFPALPYDCITSRHYLYDLVYKPDKTLFLQKGELRGAVIKNGYDMLILQAEAGWKIWNNLH